jgi:hypothetical protein
MKRINVFIVLVKPMKNIQQCLSILSIHQSQEEALNECKKFSLTYPEGYSEIQTHTLRK